ncbi:MAG: HAD family hydrolase [Candidatus Cryptobacteroides sp.]
MVKAIVFDLGGVLIDLDIDSCIRACKEEIGFEKAEEFLDPCHQKGIFMLLEKGEVTKEEFASEVISMCRPGTTPEDVAHAFRKLLVGVADYKVQLLKDLSSRYDLYLLSNNNEISMPESKAIFRGLGIPMDSIFKKLFLSYQMKMLKPGDEIFQTAISEISRLSGTPDSPVVPEEMLFLDDSQRNVDAAVRNGMSSRLCPQGADLRIVLSDLL